MPQVCNPRIVVSDRKVACRPITRAALGGALAAALVCAGSAARAGDDGDGPSVISQIMHTLGFRSAGDTYAGIDYNERSPLVVPPTRDLPPPESTDAPPAPNWPNDPDIARRTAAKKDTKARYQKDYVVESSRALLPSELDRPGKPGPNAAGGGDSTADSTMVDPRDKGAKRSLFDKLNFFHKDEYATFTGEPARESLTDPPPGYMTPSPDQPYGIGSDKQKYAVPTVANHGEVPR